MKALGLDGVSTSEVLRFCGELDVEVGAFRTGRWRDYPYLWIDATYHKVRQDGRVQRIATVVAIGVSRSGQRHVLGSTPTASEDAAFWTAFLRASSTADCRACGS